MDDRPIPTVELAAGLCERILGHRPEHVEAKRSPTFIVTVDGQPLILKMSGSRPGGALVEAWAYRQAAARGASVPEVVGTSSDPECLIETMFVGRKLWPHAGPVDDPGSFWRRAGEDLRRIHEVRAPGFGPAVWTAETVRGVAATWCPFMGTAPDKLRSLVDAGLLESKHADVLVDRLMDGATAVRTWTDGRLLHGDMEAGHVFVDHDARHYLGIIDFDQAQIGDPRWDLARVPLWDGEQSLDLLLDGYGRDVLGADDRTHLLPLYLLALSAHHCDDLIRAGRPEVADVLAGSRYERLL